MKVLFLTEPQVFYCTPREYPEAGDPVTLKLRNEMTDVIIEPAVTFETIGNELAITLTAQPADFEARNKYELILKNGANIIHLNKLIILESGTDLQNYEYSTQTNGRFKFKA